MPNKRKAGKKLLASWIAEGNLEALKIEAHRRGLSTAEFLEELIEKEMKSINTFAKNERRDG
tara:strand:+ start:17822 stop:18007 length:186 start_codon:yes stop_codon:yes gene_type:complete